MKLTYALTHPRAEPPVFASEQAACFDLTACDRVVLSKKAVLYDTGIVWDIPEGYHIKVYSRSGQGFKYDMRLCNSTGIIDADYTGTIKVKLVYDGDDPRPDWPRIGDRVAQAMLCRNVKTELIEVEEIKKVTERGEKGLGSTGK